MHLFYPISLYYLHVEPRLGLSAPKKAQREVPCAVCAPTPGCARNCRNASPTHPARRRVTRDPCPQLLPNVASRTPLLRRVSGHWACARAVPARSRRRRAHQLPRTWKFCHKSFSASSALWN